MPLKRHGFVGALLKIIRMTEPTHIVALFDGEHENDRSELNADYKANRVDYSQTPEEETPFSQLPDIYTALDFLSIKHIETTDCETDDVVGTVCSHNTITTPAKRDKKVITDIKVIAERILNHD